LFFNLFSNIHDTKPFSLSLPTYSHGDSAGIIVSLNRKGDKSKIVWNSSGHSFNKFFWLPEKKSTEHELTDLQIVLSKRTRINNRYISGICLLLTMDDCALLILFYIVHNSECSSLYWGGGAVGGGGCGSCGAYICCGAPYICGCGLYICVGAGWAAPSVCGEGW
jgi:hypothetical protein